MDNRTSVEPRAGVGSPPRILVDFRPGPVYAAGTASAGRGHGATVPVAEGLACYDPERVTYFAWKPTRMAGPPLPRPRFLTVGLCRMNGGLP
jgi:hypothetical protein